MTIWGRRSAKSVSGAERQQREEANVSKKKFIMSVTAASVLAYSSIASIAEERSTSADHERLEARRVAQSVLESY